MAHSRIDLPCLDGRRFAMVSSTASTVDERSPTVFQYHELDGMVWGEYRGDTVRDGRFVGSRDRDILEITFTHVRADTGELESGSARSHIEVSGPNGLRLIETFQTKEGEQVSICDEQT